MAQIHASIRAHFAQDGRQTPRLAGAGAPLQPPSAEAELPAAGRCRWAVVRIRSPPHVPFCSTHDQ